MNQRTSHFNDSDWISALREKGFRVTTQRLAVLNFLDNHPHANAESVFQGIRTSLPTISIQAVHLIVQDLAKSGLIRRISLPDSPSARYETRIDDNHHHIQCVRCGKTEDVDCVIGHAPCLDPESSHGMRILEASVVFSGICRVCDNSKPKRKISIKNKKEKKL